MQKKDKNRAHKLSREQQLKIKKDMELPINKFLNARDEKGELVYPFAEKLRRYSVFNPDPILADMRLSNGYLHEVRWRLELAEDHLNKHKEDNDSTYFETDAYGNKIVKKHYGGYITEQQAIHIALSRLRQQLSERLLGKCDGDFFTFEQFESFISKTVKIVADLGFELFPDKVTLIEPL